ncbi:ROK family protein [Mollicutes bacterium LVI A0039]|nr:ROK family protein [Mollicutes bacterium LVI A0039]
MNLLQENYNYRQILQLVIQTGGISRAQIARETSLNRSTISYVINYFLENKIVFETSEKVLTGGRASTLIKFNYDIEKIMIVDLQKNKVKVLITTYAGKYLDRFDFPITHGDTGNIEYIQNCIRIVLEKHNGIKSCGVAIHGIVSNTKNIITSPFYTYEYEDIIRIFEKFNLNIHIENEANIYTNGILVQDNLNITNLMNLHIKDGVGSGQILNGSLYRGDNGYAGEIGHSIVIPGGEQCRCGNKGCLELYTSERYFIKQIENITGSPYNIHDVAMLVQNNADVAVVYHQIVDLLSLKINDIILLIDVIDLYITSDLFNEISSFKDDILSRLNSRNYVKPNITVISADIELFTAGFARIILQNQFSLN